MPPKTEKKYKKNYLKSFKKDHEQLLMVMHVGIISLNLKMMAAWE